MLRVNEQVTEAVLESELDDVESQHFVLGGELHVSGVRDGLLADLQDFIDALPEAHELDFPAAQEAMNVLREIGIGVGSAFFGGTYELRAAQKFFRSAVPEWNVTDGDGVLLEFQAPLAALFPIELLPIFDYEEPWIVSDVASLADAARRILGFACVVQRKVLRRPTPRNPLGYRKRMTVKALQDVSLSWAAKEIASLKGMTVLDVDGPWPESVDRDQDVSVMVARAILDPAASLTEGLQSGNAVQVVHFACHCDSSSSVPSNYALRLQGARGGARRVSLGRLRTRMAEVGARLETAGDHFRQYPIIVMNACGASRLDPRTARSFPDLFLEHEMSFLGPEASVPDELAAQFSLRFYRNLGLGMSVGSALHDAKWTVLTRWGNPIGVLWSSYADPNFCPVAEP